MNAFGYTAPDIPLFRDQMNSDRWVELADYIYLPNNEYWGRTMIERSQGRLKAFTEGHELPDEAVIFMGTTQEMRKLLAKIPTTGKYILITRDHDYSITDELFNLRPPSVQHWFGVNFPVHNLRATAIPIGLATINGYNETLEQAARNHKEECDQTSLNGIGKPFLCRMNQHPVAMERNIFIEKNINNPLVHIITKEVPQDEFYLDILKRPYNISLAGFGKDCLRTWETIALGRIPIVSDCPEMRKFHDLPVLFAKPDAYITLEYFEGQLSMSNRSTDAARMSYWNALFKHIKSGIFI